MSHSNLKWGYQLPPQFPVPLQLRKLWFLQCMWEGLYPWENEFRWKQTSESASRRLFKSLLSDNDDEHHVDEGTD